MSRNCWWIVALLLLVLSFDNFLQALNWFHESDEDLRAEGGKIVDSPNDLDESLFEKAKQGAKSVVENVASGGKKAKESIEDTGKKARESISKTYEENIAKPLRHWYRDEDAWSAVAPWSHWFYAPLGSGHPWTHSVASLGQFRTFPNEYIVYLDMPGVPKDEIEIFVRGHRLRIHGTHGTCLTGHAGEVDRFCLERQVDRTFSIPEDVILDHIEGLLKDGVLMLKLPRLQDESSGDEYDEEDEQSGGVMGLFGSKKSKIKGKKVHVKDYKPSWKERAKEAGEAVKDTFKKTKKH